MDESESFHFSFKVAIVGDSGVGKSTLLEGEGTADGGGAAGGFQQRPVDSSVGLNFRVKLYEVGGRVYRVQFWDCPGAERYMKLTSRYCAGAAGAIFVFDVNDRATFDSLEGWVGEVEKNNTVLKVLVGNKVEDGNQSAREVTTAQAEAFADKHGMDYFETNALAGTRCDAVFRDIFTQVVENVPNPPEPSLLLKKGIKIGKRMLADRKFRSSLFLASQRGSGGANESATHLDWL